MEMLADVSLWITVVLSTVVLGLLKKVIGAKDKSFEALLGKIAEADSAIVKLTKGIQPLFLALIAIALGAGGGMITGAEAPTAEAVAAAPLATVLGVVLRELWVRFAKPVIRDQMAYLK